MYKELIHTPEGVRDIYGTEYAEKLAILRKIQDTVYLTAMRAFRHPPLNILTFFPRKSAPHSQGIFTNSLTGQGIPLF